MEVTMARSNEEWKIIWEGATLEVDENNLIWVYMSESPTGMQRMHARVWEGPEDKMVPTRIGLVLSPEMAEAMLERWDEIGESLREGVAHFKAKAAKVTAPARSAGPTRSLPAQKAGPKRFD